ncbi:hypothetical protein JCM17380_55140 [Desulfosporosinus burensis]
MLLNEKLKYTDKEIIERGSRALIKELGYSGFIRFIRQVEGHSGQDYLKDQEEVYRDMSLDDIFEEAQKHWESSGVRTRWETILTI